MAYGVNKRRNDPYYMDQENVTKHSSEHAEIAALRRVSDPRGCDVFVARVNRLGAPALSKPCDSCYSALVDAGVRKIVYT